MNETSELQAVDFALGAHIAGAFTGYKDSGPANWREFIKRPVNLQVVRHDADSPQEFIQAYLGAQEGQKVSDTGAHVNSTRLPVVYYFRKPGFTNTMDQKRSRGKVSTAAGKVFDLHQFPLTLDYTVNFLAFDKLTLDKIELAWYAWIATHGFFPARYEIGGEPFDVRCVVQDNNNMILSNASYTDGGNRMYCASSTYSVNTNVLFGSEVTVPIQRLIYGFERETEEQYVVTSETSHYAYDSGTRPEGGIPMKPGSVSVWDGAGLLGTDNGKGAIFGEGITGSVAYFGGVVVFDLAEAPAGVVSVSFAPMLGSIEVG